MDAVLKRPLHSAAVDDDAVGHKHEHAAAAGAHRRLKPGAAAVARHRQAAEGRTPAPRRHKNPQVTLPEVSVEWPEGQGEVSDRDVGRGDEQRHVLAVFVDGVRSHEGRGVVAGGAEREALGSDYEVPGVLTACMPTRSECDSADPPVALALRAHNRRSLHLGRILEALK